MAQLIEGYWPLRKPLGLLGGLGFLGFLLAAFVASGFHMFQSALPCFLAAVALLFFAVPPTLFILFPGMRKRWLIEDPQDRLSVTFSLWFVGAISWVMVYMLARDAAEYLSLIGPAS